MMIKADTFLPNEGNASDLLAHPATLARFFPSLFPFPSKLKEETQNKSFFSANVLHYESTYGEPWRITVYKFYMCP